jgi:cyclopropane fatty-acyl-phospholipid synthase-like methyltransferase
MEPDLDAPAVPAEAYDEEYFTRCCAGALEWARSGGREVPGVYRWALAQVGLEPGEVIVDVGTGRGELVALAASHGAARAVGVEYSPAAVRLAQRTMEVHEVTDRTEVLLADARRLPLPDGSADAVTMLDVVEHLTPVELDRALREVLRVLRPGGRLLVHTFPSRTVYGITYRLQRWALPWRLRTWPAQPRMKEELEMHVNEQSVRRLRQALVAAGFASPTVSLGDWVYTDFVPSERGKRLYGRLARFRLTRPLGVSNMWALAVKAP